jgi:hypothetical protein
MTYERFIGTAATRFFATAKPILDDEVVLHICEEVWATYGLPRLGSVRQAEWTRAWAARYALT